MPGGRRVIYYTDDLAAIREDMLHGFFAGWTAGTLSRSRTARDK